MPSCETLFSWLVYSALVSLPLAAIGSAAARVCHQPARRLRIIELALAGCLVVPWLGMIPGYPQLAVGRWFFPPVSQLATPASPPTIPTDAPAADRPNCPTVTALPSAAVPRGDAASSATRDRLTEQKAFVESPQRSRHASDWPAVTVTLYLGGVAVGVVWWFAGMVFLLRVILAARPAPPHCRELLAQIAGRHGDRVRLLASRRANQPFAFAWWWAAIVLPESLCGDEQAVRWALAHEWMHIERHDFRAWLLAGVARTLYFYNPLVWWLRRQLRLCQDYVADAQASRQAPAPEDYAEFLTLRAAAGSLHPAMVGLGMGFRKSELYRRVVMLVQNQPLESRAPRLWSVSATLAALMLVAAVAALSNTPQTLAGEKEKAEPDGQIAKQKIPKPDEAPAVQRRTINKLVKDFPDKVDLSTPESAQAAWNRASARMDDKAVLDLSWVKWPIPDPKLEQQRKNNPKDTEIYNAAKLNAEIIEVATYREDFADVISKLKFPEGVGRHPYSSRSFGRIGGIWKNLGENRLPSLEAAREEFDRAKDDCWKYFVQVREGIKSGKPVAVGGEQPKRSAPTAPGEELGISVEKADLMGRVEWVFMHGARDITARKTIEWGDVEKDENGNRKIRYKFEATIWDKDVMIANEVFTFDAKGNLLAMEHVEGYPQKKKIKPADVNSQAGMKDLVEDFFSKNFRDVTSREIIEWGDVEKTKDGNSSIRYKYRAKIWDKETKIMNQVFTFDSKGEYVSVKNVDGFPKDDADEDSIGQSPKGPASRETGAESIQGTVVDERGTPIAGADVLANGKTPCRSREPSDRQGRFTIDIAPSYIEEDGHFHVFLSGNGRRKIGGEATIKSRSPLVLQVARDAVLIQGVFGLNACLGDQKVASQFVGRQDLHGLKFFVTANDVVIWNGSKVVNRYGYTLDASKLPGAIDFTRDGRVIRSGYGWNDNDTVLLIALGSNLEDRPAQEGKPAVQLVLRAECLGMPFDKVQNSPDIVSSETKKILHALVSQTDLDVTDMPLRDVVEYLQEYHGVKITLDEKALAKAGVDRETPLTMKMNPTLDAVLTILLTPLGLTYKIENDQIVITTAQ